MNDYTFDDDGMPVLKSNGAVCENPYADEEDITNIFDICGDGFDVTLSLAEGTLSWTSVNPSRSGKRSSKKGFKSLFKTVKYVNSKEIINLKDILGVKIKRRRTSKQKEGEGMCLGFVVHTYELYGPNVWKERVIDFEHPSESICSKYSQNILAYIKNLQHRPQNIKLFMQVRAGQHLSKELYKNKVFPLLRAAEVNVDCVEIQHSEFIKQEMIHINLDDYDCIVCMGGDGTVNDVTSGLMNKIHSLKEMELKPGFTAIKSHVPLGIIPTGTTNHVAQSVMGTTDVVTATIHIILNNTRRVDVCSVFHEEKPLQWSFVSQYGFAGNVLALSARYKGKLGSKAADVALLKALTKSKLRSYECEVDYLPADPHPNGPVFEYTPCRTGCKVCWDEVKEIDSVTNDMVEEFNPLAVSNSSSSSGIMDLSKEESPWKSAKGSFMSVGLFGVPGNCEIAPEGLSKFSHLNDGVIHLVLVKEAPRKDFIRHLRRHGNHKNQFEMPFVEVHAVKEVRFRPRMQQSWNYRDHSYSEIEYQTKSKASLFKKRNSTRSMEILEIDDESDRHMNNNLKKTSKSVEILAELSDLEESDEDDDDEDDDIDDGVGDEVSEMDSRKGSAGSNKHSAGSGGSAGSRKINGDLIISTAHQDKRLVGPQYRMTYSDQDRLKRKNRQMKKEDKRKNKEEQKMKSYWNLDNQLCKHSHLEFKIHHGAMLICGLGISPSTTVYAESPLRFIPLMK